MWWLPVLRWTCYWSLSPLCRFSGGHLPASPPRRGPPLALALVAGGGRSWAYHQNPPRQDASARSLYIKSGLVSKILFPRLPLPFRRRKSIPDLPIDVNGTPIPPDNGEQDNNTWRCFPLSKKTKDNYLAWVSSSDRSTRASGRSSLANSSESKGGDLKFYNLTAWGNYSGNSNSSGDPTAFSGPAVVGDEEQQAELRLSPKNGRELLEKGDDMTPSLAKVIQKATLDPDTTLDRSPVPPPPPSLPPPPIPRRLRHKLNLGQGKQASIIGRTIPLTPDWNVTVWEWEKLSAVVETYWQVEQQGLALTPTPGRQRHQLLDPFGLVAWPGALIAVQEMIRHADLFPDKTVLILGAGVGLEAQVAAMLGARSVIATDIHPTTLQLLAYGAQQAGVSDVLETRLLDIFSVESLPTCQVLIVADVLYNDRLATQIARRCQEARRWNEPAVVLLSDSQRFARAFEAELNTRLRALGDAPVAWRNRHLESWTGSGVLVDADQTYDVKARVLWIGVEDVDDDEVMDDDDEVESEPESES